jgi:glycosyltransferase involved in cell wall biosynthesis
MRATIGRHADLVVSNSHGGAEYWARHGVDPERLEIVPNFVAVREIEEAGRLDDPRIGAHERLLLCVARLSPEKNLDAVIEALRLVIRDRPDVRCAFLGDGPSRDSLQVHVNAAGLANRVVFAGFVPNVASWLKRASALVAVSFYEGCPNAVLEAVVAGVPVIASDIRAHRDLLDDDSAAFVQANDVVGIAAAIGRSLDDRVAAAERASRARQIAVPQSLDTLAGRYEALYRRAIGR